jgi:hypothetical protein
MPAMNEISKKNKWRKLFFLFVKDSFMSINNKQPAFLQHQKNQKCHLKFY